MCRMGLFYRSKKCLWERENDILKRGERQIRMASEAFFEHSGVLFPVVCGTMKGPMLRKWTERTL